MWNFLSRSNFNGGRALAEPNAGSRARRRRTRLFSGVESLESRAMLSASGMDSPVDLVTVGAAADRLPPVSAEVSFIDSPAFKSGFGAAGIESDSSVQLDEPQFSLGLADAMLAAIVPNGQSQRASMINGPAFSPLGDTFTGVTGRPVELRFAETGQVVVLGSAASVQDSNGLTVKDDSAPATYLCATDADGRAFSRLVFVTRATRSAPDPELPLPMDVNGAVVAEAELLSAASSEELAARPELQEFVTALDEVHTTDSPTHKADDLQPSLAAATRTRWMSSTRVSVSDARSGGALHLTAKSAHPGSVERTDDDSEKDSSELPAMPVIDSTTRNVVLSVCLLGALARATARRRRRQKAAALTQAFAVQ